MSRPAHFYPETSWNGPADSKNAMVWLPAFGDSGIMTSWHYLPKLQSQGWSVLVANHHQVGFSMDDSVQRIYDELFKTERQRVLLLGSSFGMLIAIELMRKARLRASELSKRFSVISVCGMSSGQDSLKPIGWAKHFHGPVSGGIFKLGQAAKITTGKKSPFDQADREVADSIKPHQQFRKWHYSGRALVEQLAAMANARPVQVGEFAGTPALIITTMGTDVMLKEQAATKLHQAFSPSWIDRVELSIHADLTELPSQYGPKIWDFAENIITTEVASN